MILINAFNAFLKCWLSVHYLGVLSTRVEDLGVYSIYMFASNLNPLYFFHIYIYIYILFIINVDHVLPPLGKL